MKRVVLPLHALALSFTLFTLGCNAAPGHAGGGDLAGTGGGGDVDMAGGGIITDNGDMAGPLVIAPLDQVLTAAPGAMPTVQ